jgi:hypothetical protein
MSKDRYNVIQSIIALELSMRKKVRKSKDASARLGCGMDRIGQNLKSAGERVG